MIDMKHEISRLLAIFLVSIAMLSCSNTEKKKEVKDSQKINNETLKLNDSDYKTSTDWKLTWSDEFETDSIDSNNWNFQVEEAGRFNDEWQRYTDSDENAYINDSCLVIEAVHESETHGMNQYTSARLHTGNKQSWKYGKIAARIKLPYGNGIWPAFWMLGANIDENGGDTPWPQSGEIDILELYGSKDDGLVEANIHYADASGKHTSIGATGFKLKEGKFADAFHIFELEWDENELIWLVDGEQYASTPITSNEHLEFHKEFFILLNVAVGGKHSGLPNETTVFPQKMYVDWIRVYKKDEN